MDSVSVIIPVYNRIDVLERCVRSVQEQTYADIEIILVDDGSTDGSEELCFSLSSQDSRTRAAHIRHGGASAARNAGLMMSSGSYVCFLDSDDCISKGMIERLYNDIRTMDADMASCRFRIEGPQEQLFVSTSGDVTALTPHEAFEKMLINDGLCGYGVSPGTKRPHKTEHSHRPVSDSFPGKCPVRRRYDMGDGNPCACDSRGNGQRHNDEVQLRMFQQHLQECKRVHQIEAYQMEIGLSAQTRIQG